MPQPAAGANLGEWGTLDTGPCGAKTALKATFSLDNGAKTRHCFIGVYLGPVAIFRANRRFNRGNQRKTEVGRGTDTHLELSLMLKIRRKPALHN